MPVKIRTGKLKSKEVQLKEGADFTLTTANLTGDNYRVHVSLPQLPQNVKRNDIIYLNDGAIKLKVIGATTGDVKCRVIVGGVLGWEKGVNVPDITLKIPSLTEKDFADILFGIEHGADFIALSFIRESEDVHRVRRFLKRKKSRYPPLSQR
jgi:pyruvate kinase